MPRKTTHLSLEEKIQLLMDERDIRALQFRWCRAVDRNDIELMKTCFHPDAIDHHAPFYDGPVEDLKATFVEDNKGVGETSQYNIGNMLIDVDGDKAFVESYAWSQKTMHERAENGDKIMRVSGLRYLDRMERRGDGEWLIAERWFVPDFGFFTDVPPVTKAIGIILPPDEITLKPLPSRRDQTDQSYLIS